MNHENEQFIILDKRLIDIQGRLRFLNLQQKEIRKLMSELTDAVQAIKDDVVRVGDDVKAVLALLTQPNPDVPAAVEALKAADQGLDAAAESMEAVIHPPTP